VGDQYAHLGRGGVPEPDLRKGLPPHPELVGDHPRVPGVALVLASAVGIAGAVDRETRDVEEVLPDGQQRNLEHRRRPTEEIDGDLTLAV